MKIAASLSIWLLLSGAALTAAPTNPAQGGDGFDSFWQEFKTAVIKGDKEKVVRLSGFPIRMPGRVRNIKDAADLRLRYREVFNKRVNAARCFAEKDSTPVADSENPKVYAVFCYPGDAIVYRFERTKTGWKFVRLLQEVLPD